MMKNSGAKRPKPFWLKILIGFGTLFFLIVAIVAIPVGQYIYHSHTDSLLWIVNSSDLGVRFEKVMIDDQIVWEGPAIIIKSKHTLKQPEHRNLGGNIMPHFRAPKKLVELKLVVIDQMQERETVSCMLDNRSRPCFFEVFYHKGSLSCSEDCDKSFMH